MPEGTCILHISFLILVLEPFLLSASYRKMERCFLHFRCRLGIGIPLMSRCWLVMQFLRYLSSAVVARRSRAK